MGLPRCANSWREPLHDTSSEVSVLRALYPAFVLTQADSRMLSEA